jgi:hypothetical protein
MSRHEDLLGQQHTTVDCAYTATSEVGYALLTSFAALTLYVYMDTS